MERARLKRWSRQERHPVDCMIRKPGSLSTGKEMNATVVVMPCILLVAIDYTLSTFKQALSSSCEMPCHLRSVLPSVICLVKNLS